MAKKKTITVKHYWGRAKLDPLEHLNESHPVYAHVSVKRMNNYFKSVKVGACTGSEYCDAFNSGNDLGKCLEKEKDYVKLLLNKILFENNEWLILKGLQEHLLMFEDPVLFNFILKRLKDHIYSELVNSRFNELLEIFDWNIDPRIIFKNLRSFGKRNNDPFLLEHLSQVQNLLKHTENEIKAVFNISGNDELHQIDLFSIFKSTHWCQILNKLANTDELEYILQNSSSEYKILGSTEISEAHYLVKYIQGLFEIVIDNLSEVDNSDELKFINYKHDCLTHIFS